MISKINITEFRKRLNLNTKFGNPKLKGTPFHVFSAVGDAEKIFFGSHNKSSFQLTMNAFLYPTPYIMFGEIKSNKNSETEIYYEIKPIGFGYYWLKYFTFSAIIILNIIFVVESTSIERTIMPNMSLVLFNIFIYFKTKTKKNNMEKKFKQVFEIVD